MKIDVERKYGAEALQIGKGGLLTQCHAALKELSGDDEERGTRLLNEFMHLSVKPDKTLLMLKAHHPRLIWAQLTDVYPTLATTLMQVYQAPASTSGTERNHKVGKKVHTSVRSRLSAGKVERQLAIAHNGHFLNREREMRSAAKQRIGGFESIIAAVASDQVPEADITLQDDNEDEDISDDEVFRRVADASSVDDIQDDDILRTQDESDDEF